MRTSFVKLGSCIKQYRNEIWVDDSMSYGQITVSGTGTISHRGTKSGAIIGRKRQFIVDLKAHPNTLIFTRQGIYDGAIGFAPSDTDGCIATENMPMFSLKSGISREYMEQFLLSAVFKTEVKKLAPKGAAQKSVHERVLLEVPIPLPPIETQIAIATSVAKKRQFIRTIQHEIAHQEALLGKLKQAILQEAIQGKLTEEWREAHPDTEPASELLKRIQKEKARLIADKKLRKGKPLPKITPVEIPFEIPKSWEWCRMGDICGFITKGTTPAPHKLKPTGDIPFLKVYNIRAQRIDFDYRPQFIDQRIHEGDLSRSIVYPQDVLMNIVGPPLGKVAIVPNKYSEWNINQALAVFRPLKIEINQLLYLFLCEGAPIRATVTKGVVGQDNISLAQCRALMFPLPPLAEQAAIVERVEALITTCRALETEIEHSRTHAAHLLQAVLKEAFSPAS